MDDDRAAGDRAERHLLLAIYVESGAELEVIVRCLTATAILSLAAITYCSLFGWMSLLTKRSLMVGIVYIAIVEEAGPKRIDLPDRNAGHRTISRGNMHTVPQV